MATLSWGGAVDNTNLFTYDNGVGLYNTGVSFPLGNLTRAGTRPVQISSITPSYVNNTTGTYVYGGSARQSSGFHTSSGGSFTFYVLKSGGVQAFFGRNTAGGGTSTWTPSGGSVGGRLPGSLVWSTGTTAARSVTAQSPSSGTVKVDWVAPSSNGGSAVTGYRVEYSKDNWATFSLVDVGVVLTTNLTGLANGFTYKVRVFAKNANTTTAGTMSPVSNEASVFAGYWTFSGNSAYAVTVTNPGSASDPLSFRVEHTVDFSGVEANAVISASVIMHLSAGETRGALQEVTVNPFFDWLDSTGSVVKTVILATVLFRDEDRLIPYRSMVKPSSAATGRFRLEVPQFLDAPVTPNLQMGDVLSFDGAMVVNGTLQPFFDGNTAGVTWLGTVNNSRSQQPNPNPTNLLYSASVDGNRVLSTSAGVTTNTILITTSYPTQIDTLTATDTLPAPNGTYYVTDSAGFIVPASEWVAAGGAVRATVGERPGTIVVTFIGPSTLLGHDGPYYLASGDTSDRVAQFSITGTGVTTNPTDLNLSTGADPATVTNEVAKEIDNPFIDTRQQAFERGVWSGITAARPMPSMSVTVPLYRLESFGLVSGALVQYHDSIYRVFDIQLNVSTATIQAEWYVTTADFEALWSSRQTLAFENRWSGYKSGDFTVAPLRDNTIQ